MRGSSPTRSSRRLPHGAPRGQATLELALGMLLFITVLAFGIHFAEVGYLSMRVQQAAAFAIYDATGQRVHNEGDNWGPGGNMYGVAGLSTSEARKRFRDFEALTGGDHNAAPVTHVFTSIDQMQIQCTNENSISYSTSPPLLGLLTPNPFDGSRGGLKCTASATVNLTPAFPRNFFDGEWGLRTANYAGSRTSYRVCATPRAANGNCGQFGILLGDFSLQGPTESRSVDLFSNGNPTYRDLVSSAAGPVSCPAALALSGAIALTAQPFACSFQMSYRGVEHNYRQNIRSAHTGDRTWITGGTNSRRNPSNNQRTYLGVNRNW